MQFANDIAGCAGLSLGDTSARGCSCMLNSIGELRDRDAAPCRGALARLRQIIAAGRKVGHATVCAADAVTLAHRMGQLGEVSRGQVQIAQVIKALTG